MIRNPEIQATRYSGITTTVFSTKWILPVNFKPSKRPLNHHNFFTANQFSLVRNMNYRLDYMYEVSWVRGKCRSIIDLLFVCWQLIVTWLCLLIRMLRNIIKGLVIWYFETLIRVSRGNQAFITHWWRGWETYRHAGDHGLLLMARWLKTPESSSDCNGIYRWHIYRAEYAICRLPGLFNRSTRIITVRGGGRKP